MPIKHLVVTCYYNINQNALRQTTDISALNWCVYVPLYYHWSQRTEKPPAIHENKEETSDHKGELFTIKSLDFIDFDLRTYRNWLAALQFTWKVSPSTNDQAQICQMLIYWFTSDLWMLLFFDSCASSLASL